MWTGPFYHQGMFFKSFFANSADLNETAPWEQSDLGLHCFLRQSV